MNREPIPPLELAFIIAAEGGWDKVEVLTHARSAPPFSDPIWRRVMYPGYYLTPLEHTYPEAWEVYGVRRKQP